MDQIGFKIRQKVSFYNIAKKWKKEQNGTKRFKKVQKGTKLYKNGAKRYQKVQRVQKDTKRYENAEGAKEYKFEYHFIIIWENEIFFPIFTHCVRLFCGNKQHVVIEGAKAIFIQP